MSTSFLDFHYKISKRKYLRKPSRLFSRDRQYSGLKPVCQPNVDETEMRLVFDKFDRDEDGKISKEDYKATLESLGMKNKTGDVTNIFQVVDLAGDGFINFKEFMYAQKKGDGISTKDVESAFRIFTNGKKISAAEVHKMLQGLGESCSLEDCRRMVEAVDTDGDGMVDMNEFKAMMDQSLRQV